MKAYRNSEHYSDPTAGKALDNVMQERQAEVKKSICEVRCTAGLSGFEIKSRGKNCPLIFDCRKGGANGQDYRENLSLI